MILAVLLLNSLFCVGLYNATQEGFILAPIRKAKLPEWVARPLYDCIYCMASIWSIPFALDYGLEWTQWIFYIPILSAVNGITFGIFDKLTSSNG